MKKLVLLVASVLLSTMTLILPWSAQTVAAASTPNYSDTFQTKDATTITDTTTSSTFTAFSGDTFNYWKFDSNSVTTKQPQGGIAYVSSTPNGQCTEGKTTFETDGSDHLPFSDNTVDSSQYRAATPPSSDLNKKLETNDVMLVSGTTAYYWGFRKSANQSICSLQVQVKQTSAIAAPAGGGAGNAITFDWVDAGTIQNAAQTTKDGSVWTYTLAADTNPAQFRTTSTYGTNSDQQGSCTDYITVPSAGSTTGYYFFQDNSNRQPTSSGSGQNTNIIFQQASGTPTGKDPASGCYGFRFSITLDATNAALPAGTGAGSGSAAVAAPTCDVGSLSWIVCSVISAADDTIKFMETKVQEQLQFSPLSSNSTTNSDGSSSLYSVWKSFRNLADVFFVLIFMLVIFGTAFGMDNYTVKKILPKLIAAAILIQFSYYIVGIMVDISNVLGAGINSLVSLTPAGGTAKTASSAVGFSIIGLAGIGTIVGLALTGVWIPALLGIIGAVIALFVAYITLQLRIIIIEVLVVIAPIAFLAGVLPNTEKWFKRWRAMLLDLLMMYPVIMLLFLGGTIFSITPSVSGAPGTASSQNVFQALIKALAPIIVFFLIPATFKIAEGALTKGGGMLRKTVGKGVNSGASGLGKRAKEAQTERALKKIGTQQTEPPKGLLGKLGQRTAITRAGYGFHTQEGLTARRESQMLGAVSKVESTEQAGFARKFENMNKDAIMERIMDTKSTANERKAGLSTLAKKRETGTLNKILQGKYGGDVSNAEYKSGVSGSFSELKAASPHLVMGDKDGSAYDNLNAEGLASLNPDGWGAAAARAQSNPVARQNMADAIERINATPNLNGKITPANRATMNSIHTPQGGTPAGSSSTGATSGAARATTPAQANAALDTYADHVASLGYTRPSRDELTDRLKTDPTFSAAVDTATAHGTPVHNVLPPMTSAPTTTTAHINIPPAAPIVAPATGGAPTFAGNNSGVAPVQAAASAPSDNPAAPASPAPAQPKPAPRPNTSAWFRNHLSGTDRPSGRIIVPPLPGDTGTGGSGTTGTSPAARQQPRISERLVDPRVEGQSDDHLA